MNARRRLLKLLDEAMEGCTDATGCVRLCRDLFACVPGFCIIIRDASASTMPAVHSFPAACELGLFSNGCCCTAFCSFSSSARTSVPLGVQKRSPHSLHSWGISAALCNGH